MDVIAQEEVGRGQILFRDPNRFHDRTYLIAITCRVFRNRAGVVHRGLIWRVYRRRVTSALIEVVGADGTANDWEVAREPEAFLNGDFEVFSRQIRDVVEGVMGWDVTFELNVGGTIYQVSNEYLRQHGFDNTNTPWMILARYYREHPPETVDPWDRPGSRGKSGFRENDYKEAPTARLDPETEAKFSPEELREAETQAQILRDAEVRAKRADRAEARHRQKKKSGV